MQILSDPYAVNLLKMGTAPAPAWDKLDITFYIGEHQYEQTHTVH